MIWIDLAILVAVVVLAGFVGSNAYHNWKESKGKTTFPLHMHDMERDITLALKKMQCGKVEWEGDTRSRSVMFEYQGGIFCINLENDSPFARLTFRNFFTTGIENLDTMRIVCNLCNINSGTCDTLYSINSEKGRISAHLSVCFPPMQNATADMMAALIKDIFGWRNAMIVKFEELRNDTRHNESKDVERDNAEIEQELHLIRKQERDRNDDEAERPIEQRQTASATALLALATGTENIKLLDMTAFSEKLGSRKFAPEEMEQYDLSNLLIDENRFTDNNITVLLTYTDNRMPSAKQSASINLRQEEESKKALLFRTTTTLLPPERTALSTSESPSGYGTSVHCAVFGRTLASEDDRRSEFVYMKKEAEESFARQGLDGLTEAQKLIQGCEEGIAETLYKGYTMFRQCRFAEALPHFDAAFKALKGTYNSKDRTKADRFIELCYLTGFCYCELRQFDRACYYLEFTLNTRQINYTEEYINCLVNSQDPRAEDIIKSLLADLHSSDYEPNEYSGRGIDGFINFLRRRRAYIYVSSRRFDDAERMLKKMLDEPANSDYALGELAYIQRQRNRAADGKES